MASISFCAQTLHIELGSEGHRLVFVTSAQPESLPLNQELRTERTVDLETATNSASDWVCIWDRDANNLAVRKLGDLKGSWVVHPEDFSQLGVVQVRVEYQGKPVSAAQVKLIDKKRTISRLLDPSSNGEAAFFGVAPGEVKVVVDYNSGGHAADPVVQRTDLSLKRQKPEPRVIVSLPDKTEVIEPRSAPAGTSQQTDESKKSDAPDTKSDKKNEPSSIGSAIIYLLILAGLGYGGYVLFKKLRDDKGQMADKLRSLGVPVAPDPVLPTGTPVAPPEPEPMKPIVLSDAAPDPDPPDTHAPKPLIASPRLVKSDGSIYQPSSGVSTVGRESADLTLTGESSVSRTHAQFTFHGGMLTLEDLGSTNGTFVNGQRISVPTNLHPGDQIQFGAVRYRVEG